MNGEVFPFVAGCIFFGIGALLIGSLLGFLFQRLRLQMSMVRTAGRIIALETLSATAGKKTLAHAADAPPPDPSATLHYRPVVEFTVDGKSYQCRGDYRTQRSTTVTTNVGGNATFEMTTAPLDADTGQPVPVAYRKSNPADAMVIDIPRTSMVIVVQIFFGLMFMTIGLLAFYANGNLGWLGPDWRR